MPRQRGKLWNRLGSLSSRCLSLGKPWAKKQLEEYKDILIGKVLKEIGFLPQVFEPAPAVKPQRTAEDLAEAERRAKEYSRRCLHKERLWQQVMPL